MLRIGFAIALSLAATAARADCQICDRVARLDEPLAKCFLQRYEQVKLQPGDPLMVNLADCSPDTRKRGPVAGLPRPTSQARPVSDVLIVERPKLTCIKDHLVALGTTAKWPVDLDLTQCR